MSGGFQHDIAGGSGSLIITALRSPNFVDGLTGWEISKDGSAEFNNLEIRGTFNGTDFILNQFGLFFYSGTPAYGNLIGSWTQAAGTDSEGNHYDQGICIGVQSNTEIQVRPDLDAIFVYAGSNL